MSLTLQILPIILGCLSALVTSIAAYKIQAKKLKSDIDMTEKRIQTDLAQQERQIRNDFEMDRERMRTEFMAEQVVKQLLESKEWQKRSFKVIKSRIGGFSDDELRKILVRSGAIRFRNNENDEDELWGLLNRNKDDI